MTMSHPESVNQGTSRGIRVQGRDVPCVRWQMLRDRIQAMQVPAAVPVKNSKHARCRLAFHHQQLVTAGAAPQALVPWPAETLFRGHIMLVGGPRCMSAQPQQKVQVRAPLSRSIATALTCCLSEQDDLSVAPWATFVAG